MTHDMNDAELESAIVDEAGRRYKADDSKSLTAYIIEVTREGWRPPHKLMPLAREIVGRQVYGQSKGEREVVLSGQRDHIATVRCALAGLIKGMEMAQGAQA